MHLDSRDSGERRPTRVKTRYICFAITLLEILPYVPAGMIFLLLSSDFDLYGEAFCLRGKLPHCLPEEATKVAVPVPTSKQRNSVSTSTLSNKIRLNRQFSSGGSNHHGLCHSSGRDHDLCHSNDHDLCHSSGHDLCHGRSGHDL